MTEPFQLKYRPTKFADLIGQEAVTKSVQQLLEKNTSHAFLFYGPSGCGKTTLARICAKELGCKKNDVLEVDAATYTGVDSVREITAKLLYRPMNGSTVLAIILDECHSLTKQSWQALLKSIEEPPSWVYWFFCTTESQKVPETIRTRCASFELKTLYSNQLLDILNEVAEKENLKLPDGILSICAKQAQGSPRRALVNLAICLEATSRAEAFEMLKAPSEDGEAIDLARLLLKGATWEQAKPLLSSLKDTNPESIRHTIRAYMTTAILSSTTDKAVTSGLTILEEFSTPFDSMGGISPVVRAVGRLIFS